MYLDYNKIVSSKGRKFSRRKKIDFHNYRADDFHHKAERSNVFPLMIIKRGNQTIVLQKPIEVTIHRESGHYIAENKNLEIRAEGETIGGSMDSFIDKLCENFKYYDNKIDNIIDRQIMERYSGAWKRLAKL